VLLLFLNDFFLLWLLFLDKCWLVSWSLDWLSDWNWNRGWGWSFLWSWLSLHFVILALAGELHVFRGMLNEVFDVSIWILCVVIIVPVVVFNGICGSKESADY